MWGRESLRARKGYRLTINELAGDLFEARGSSLPGNQDDFSVRGDAMLLMFGDPLLFALQP
jgi:hypothetical protein